MRKGGFTLPWIVCFVVGTTVYLAATRNFEAYISGVWVGIAVFSTFGAIVLTNR